MKNVTFLMGFLLTILLVSCGNNQGTETSTTSIDEDRKQINELEAKMSGTDSQAAPDQGVADKAIQCYVTFAEKYPDDEMSPRYLFRAGKVAMSMNRGNLAIQYFQKVLKDFPDAEDAPLSLFMQGFVYETVLMDYKNAEKYYKLFIEKHPDHEFAEDAKISIEQLGIPPEELIKQFEKQQGDSVEVASV